MPAERSEKGPAEKRQAQQCNLWKSRGQRISRAGDNPMKLLCWVTLFSPGTESDLGKIIDFFPESSFSRMGRAENSL